ncbi:hypothetical protein CVT24_001843 [Panaeolus cyanescens]|uniref:Aldose 1-epimerase n=1 Tax=Panaeolus cyanescens TaxID=181874 RepID=A0A409YEW2_9AGAR|nr:hypothetical protein CVT24_001843 [Panaeolus cyanescens]
MRVRTLADPLIFLGLQKCSSMSMEVLSFKLNLMVPFDVIVLQSPDDSITAKFVSFGSTLTELWVKDKDGVSRNVVLGYDDNATLHGGVNGWDRRNWRLVGKSKTSVTFEHVDKADEGFPGIVTATAAHTVLNGGRLKTVIKATATEKVGFTSSLQFTLHIYWNLDAFQNGSDKIYDHELRLDASKVIDVNEVSIPTGKFIDVESTPFDFRKERKLGDRWKQTIDLCGKGALDISTNQPAAVVYTSFWLNTIRKNDHGGPSLKYDRSSAIAIEQQGHVAAINTPEWGVDQIYGPDREYEWVSEYKFSQVV